MPDFDASGARIDQLQRELDSMRRELADIRRYSEQPTPSTGKYAYAVSWGLIGGVYSESSPLFCVPIACSLTAMNVVLGEADTSGLTVSVRRNGVAILTLITGTGTQYNQVSTPTIPCVPITDKLDFVISSDGDGTAVNFGVTALFS